MEGNVWVIDDDPGILEVIQVLFEEEGIRGEFISTPAQLTRYLAASNYPILILLDVYIAGSDGVEIAQQIKSNPATASIPIVLMTADTDITKKMLSSQADEYLAKPFDIDDLLHIVQKYTT